MAQRLRTYAFVLAATAFSIAANCAAAAAEDPAAQSGIASTYSSDGQPTASGEVSNSKGMTAAHRTLAFGTMVQVTNSLTGQWVVVRINDRGPFTVGRVIDVTSAAAEALGFTGLTHVDLFVVVGAPQ